MEQLVSYERKDTFSIMARGRRKGENIGKFLNKLMGVPV